MQHNDNKKDNPESEPIRKDSDISGNDDTLIYGGDIGDYGIGNDDGVLKEDNALIPNDDTLMESSASDGISGAKGDILFTENTSFRNPQPPAGSTTTKQKSKSHKVILITLCVMFVAVCMIVFYAITKEESDNVNPQMLSKVLTLLSDDDEENWVVVSDSVLEEDSVEWEIVEEEIVEDVPYGGTNKLEGAFKAIASLDGFEMMYPTTEECGYPDEMGNIKMAIHANSEHRDKVVAILSKIPSYMTVAEKIDERGKITRWYKEDLDNGETQMMFVFIGFGGNDLVVQLFSGSSRTYYQEISEEIKEAFK